MRTLFGTMVVCLGLIVMLVALVHGASESFFVANWAAIGVGAWFSLIGCILIPAKRKN
ncbi:MAG: hypothetical protein SVV80_08425 [Planctomycetota bacterium]|nr:hypothetical protein [Planctomycetota bacterium]